MKRTLLSLGGAVSVVAACVTTDTIEPDGGGGSDADEVEDTTSAGAGDVGGSGGHTSPAPCGDGVCTAGESCEACPEDCTCMPIPCGDGSCDPGETCDNCAEDCGGCDVCGDGSCGAAEDCDICFQDCGVCACAADTFEPNGSSGTATPLSLGVDHCDLSVCAGDVDWLEIQVSSGFTATLTFFQGEGDLDLEIYSAATLDYVTGSYSSDDDEIVMLSGLPGGTYWARVYGKAGAENPDYCFRADP